MVSSFVNTRNSHARYVTSRLRRTLRPTVVVSREWRTPRKPKKINRPSQCCCRWTVIFRIYFSSFRVIVPSSTVSRVRSPSLSPPQVPNNTHARTAFNRTGFVFDNRLLELRSRRWPERETDGRSGECRFQRIRWHQWRIRNCPLQRVKRKIPVSVPPPNGNR